MLLDCSALFFVCTRFRHVENNYKSTEGVNFISRWERTEADRFDATSGHFTYSMRRRTFSNLPRSYMCYSLFTMSTKGINDLVKVIEDCNREIRADNRSLKHHVQFRQDTLYECKNDIKEMNAFRSEVNDLKRENSEVKLSNHKLLQEINALAQYQRLNNLQIKGIPSEVPDPTNVTERIAVQRA